MGSATGQNEEGGGSTAVRNTIAAGTGCGCLLSPVALVGTVIIVIVIGGFGVLLAPLIALIMFFGGGGSDSDNQGTADQVIASLQGDGSGELDTSTVPEDLVETIEDAGELCGAIGPIVIASQIERESGFDAALVGPDGKQGISQLPPDKFTQYGKDDDDNDKVSALDAEDSIMAQGRYMCALADEAQKMIDNGEVVRTGTTDTALDLALAAYHVGMDAVRAAKGVPNTNEAQGYVLAVRAQFAKYEGIAAPPSGATPGVTPDPT